MAQMYAIPLAPTAVTAQADLWELNVASTCAAVVHAIYLSQTTESGDAQDEMIGISLISGYATSGNGTGATIAAINGSGTAASTAETVATTLASTGSPVTRHTDAFNVRGGWQYIPTPESRITLPPSARLVVRLAGAPTDSTSFTGTLIYEEIK